MEAFEEVLDETADVDFRNGWTFHSITLVEYVDKFHEDCANVEMWLDGHLDDTFGGGFESEIYFFLHLFYKSISQFFLRHRKMLKVTWIKQIELHLTFIPSHNRRFLMFLDLVQVLPVDHYSHPMIHKAQKEDEDGFTSTFLEIGYLGV